MKSWTIRQRVAGGFALKLALMTLISAVALRQLHDIDQASNRLRADSLPGLQLSSRITVAALTSYGLAQQHVISVDNDVMGKLEEVITRQHTEQERLLTAYEKTVSRADDRALLASLRAAPSVRRCLIDC